MNELKILDFFKFPLKLVVLSQMYSAHVDVCLHDYIVTGLRQRSKTT